MMDWLIVIILVMQPLIFAGGIAVALYLALQGLISAGEDVIHRLIDRIMGDDT